MPFKLEQGVWYHLCFRQKPGATWLYEQELRINGVISVRAKCWSIHCVTELEFRACTILEPFFADIRLWNRWLATPYIFEVIEQHRKIANINTNEYWFNEMLQYTNA